MLTKGASTYAQGKDFHKSKTESKCYASITRKIGTREKLELGLRLRRTLDIDCHCPPGNPLQLLLLCGRLCEALLVFSQRLLCAWSGSRGKPRLYHQLGPPKQTNMQLEYI